MPPASLLIAQSFIRAPDGEVMSHGLTVFVCSTFADLAPEREAVLDAIRKLQLQHDSMEYFGARPDLPLETRLAEVRRSHVLVVVVGHRYGTLVPDLGISFSEAEYSEGIRLGKPCLIYMLDENVLVLPKNVERDPDKIRRLDHWKATLRERHTVASFSNANDLAVSVAADLARTVQTIANSEAAKAHHGTSSSDISDVLAEAKAHGISSERLLSLLRQSIRSTTNSSDSRQPRVFFSYSHADGTIVRKIAEYVRASGVEVWIDVAELKPGDSVINSIERGLDSADFVAFFISSSSLKSRWASQEIDIAMTRQMSGDGGAILLPILLEDVDLPPLLRSAAYIDVRNGDIESATRLLTDVINKKFGRFVEHGERTKTIRRHRAYVLITNAKAQAIAHTRRILSNLPEVVEVTETFGSVDMVVVLAADDLQRINTIVKHIHDNPDIRSTTTLLGDNVG